MPRTNRQLLIALFSAFCLLWLSAFNSAQANAALPNQSQTIHFDSATISANCPNDTHSQEVNHHAKVEHQSCSSVCVMKMPFDPISYALQLSPTGIAPIGHDVAGKAISRTQTLFRPPIS